MRGFWLIAPFVVLFSSGIPGLAGFADDLAVVQQRNNQVWEPNQLYCSRALPSDSSVQTTCGSHETCFPTSAHVNDGGQGIHCEDGDMTLFNALLCFAKIQAGCDAVTDAQNTLSGQWYRSPRIKDYPRLRTVNGFSTDQALGLMLWLAEEPTADRKKVFTWWLDWVGRIQRCVADGCSRKVPRVCSDDDIDGNPEAELGCTLQLAVLAVLGQVVDKLHLSVSDPSLKAALTHAAPNAVALTVLNIQNNDFGYPFHLVSIEALILRLVGVNSDILDNASIYMSCWQPQNPYFRWLTLGNSKKADRAECPKNNQIDTQPPVDHIDTTDAAVAALVLKVCPATQQDVPPENDRFEWAWQRADAKEEWRHTMLWDCSFMAGLLTR
jgi:hypothetical protein